MTREEIIQSLELLKAEIEWDKPIDYQVTLDETIKILSDNSLYEDLKIGLEQAIEIEQVRVWDKYVITDIFCPKCKTKHLRKDISICYTSYPPKNKKYEYSCPYCGYSEVM